jgi:hypothetical protein
MHELRDDPNYEDVKTSHLFTALEAAMQIQKKKVIVGPNDSVGIVLFNTVRFALYHIEFMFTIGHGRLALLRQKIMLQKSRKTLSFISLLRS